MQSQINCENGQRSLFLALCELQLALVAALAAGLEFGELGSASMFALLGLAASATGLLVRRLRDYMARLTFLLLGLFLLRAMGTLWVRSGGGLLNLSLLWLTMLLVLLAALDLCISRRGKGLIKALREFLPTVTTDAYLRDMNVWWTYRLVFWPLVSIVVPIAISLLLWADSTGLKQVGEANMGRATAVSVGLLLPLAILSEGVFSLGNRDGVTSTSKPGFALAGHGVKMSFIVSASALLYLVGLASEYRSAGMYTLWTMCFGVLVLTLLNLGWFSAFLSGRTEPPPQFLAEAKPLASKWRRAGSVFLLLYAFGIAYTGLLFLAFRN